jgi:hypothetical protein
MQGRYVETLRYFGAHECLPQIHWADGEVLNCLIVRYLSPAVLGNLSPLTTLTSFSLMDAD